MARGKIALAVSAMLLVAACGQGGETVAQSEAKPVYAGKTITILVPFSAGSSGDITARIIAKEFPQHIPGAPKVVVKLAEGGGGALAMRQLANSGSDGSTIVVATTGVLLRWLLGEQGHDYPLEKMPILSAFPGTQVTVVRSEAGTTIAELAKSKKPLRGANTAVGSSLAFSQQVSADLFGLKIRQIFGYPGPAEFAVAMERAEVEVATPTDLTYANSMPPLVEKGIVTPLYQDGLMDSDGKVVRSGIVPDVPTAFELYKETHGVDPSGPAWDAYLPLIAGETISIPFIASQDIEPRYLAALRKAFGDASKTSSWKDQMKTTFKSEVPLTDAEASETAFKAFTSLSPASLAYFKEMAKKK
jgi:tripartite-type tricarboxylate transporter receptor subunit TctC